MQIQVMTLRKDYPLLNEDLGCWASFGKCQMVSYSIVFQSQTIALSPPFLPDPSLPLTFRPLVLPTSRRPDRLDRLVKCEEHLEPHQPLTIIKPHLSKPLRSL